MTSPLTERISRFDELRGIAIIGVIAAHAAAHDINYASTSWNYWILSISTLLGRFAVPSFLILSGFFISYKEKHDEVFSLQKSVLRRVDRIFPPYLIWSSIYFLIFVLLGSHYSRNPIQIYLEQLITGTVALHLYFVVLILQMYALCYLGFMKNGNLSFTALILVASIFLVFSLPSYWLALHENGGSKTTYYFIAYERSLFPRWLPFFIVGRWMGARWERVKNYAENHSSALLMCLIFSFSLCVLEFSVLRNLSPRSDFLAPDWMISFLFFGSLFTIWFLTRNIRENNILHVLRKLGVVSFGVYLIHEPLLTFMMYLKLFHANTMIFPTELLRLPFFILSSLGISLIAISLMQHFFPKRLKRYILG